jgi:hypothetical protein
MPPAIIGPLVAPPRRSVLPLPERALVISFQSRTPAVVCAPNPPEICPATVSLAVSAVPVPIPILPPCP